MSDGKVLTSDEIISRYEGYAIKAEWQHACYWLGYLDGKHFMEGKKLPSKPTIHLDEYQKGWEDAFGDFSAN
jgi:hypothetical protein